MFVIILQMNCEYLTQILKRRIIAAGLRVTGYAFNSFRSGMVSSVLALQSGVKGKEGLIYADSLMHHLEVAGQWNNSR